MRQQIFDIQIQRAPKTTWGGLLVGKHLHGLASNRIHHQDHVPEDQ
jgi:hypothetical protein